MTIELTPELVGLLSTVFALGSWCTSLQIRVQRAERIAKKAHIRVDKLTGSDWVTTGQYRQIEEGER